MKYFKKYNNYLDFSEALDKCDNKIKGDVSEEYWLRWLHYTPIVSNYIKIHNTNDPKSIHLIDKWPELTALKVGQPNSALVDLLIEYENDYDVVQCKWYAEGLSFKDIGGFYLLTNDHLPNCRNKYLTTTAPRTSKLAQELGKMGKDVITLYEDEFIVDNDIWQKISCWKKGEKIVPTKWNWRTKREQESFIKLSKSILRNKRTKFQGPPAYGKTFLMYRIERYLWRRFGGITINMADSVISLKQNYLLFNTQDSAIGISRPNLVICRGADDGDLVDWPCKVVGNDPVAIYKWIKKYPDGRVWCFYGNTLSLQAATQTYIKKIDPNFKYTSALLDEGSRSCQKIGSGWSHIVHDHLIPVEFRGTFDATPRIGKKIGMDNKKLYGPYGDHVTQPQSEHWGSTTSFNIIGMCFNTTKRATKLKEDFENREFVQGKNYTVEDYCMAVQILEAKASDPDDQHTIEFGVKIKRLKLLKQATEDALNDLLTNYPKTKSIQRLKNIKLFVADTHIMSTSEIHRKLHYIYKNNTQSIVFTSRLLYRAWSQVKLDSVYFADNFKGVSYIVQALGRGLRINPDKPNKICRVYVPVDVDNEAPWKILLDLVGSIKDWDYRPMESILNLTTFGRNPGKRKPGGGQVFINTKGVKISIDDVLKDLKNTIFNEHNDWVIWDQWHELAKVYLSKIETFLPYLRNPIAINKISNKIYDEVRQDKQHAVIIDEAYDNMPKHANRRLARKDFVPVSKQFWVWDSIWKRGAKGVHLLQEFIEIKSAFDDELEDTVNREKELIQQTFELICEANKNNPHCFDRSGTTTANKAKLFKEDLLKLIPQELKDINPFTLDHTWKLRIPIKSRYWCIKLGEDFVMNSFENVLSECEKRRQEDYTMVAKEIWDISKNHKDFTSIFYKLKPNCVASAKRELIEKYWWLNRETYDRFISAPLKEYIEKEKSKVHFEFKKGDQKLHFKNLLEFTQYTYEKEGTPIPEEEKHATNPNNYSSFNNDLNKYSKVAFGIPNKSNTQSAYIYTGQGSPTPRKQRWRGWELRAVSKKGSDEKTAKDIKLVS